MHEDHVMAFRILAIGGGLVALIWLGSLLVRVAKRGGGGMQALGAALMMFGWGHMRDPANNPVKEAQEGQRTRGETGADPLDPP